MAKENNGEKRVDRALRSFVDQLVARMEDASKDLKWTKGWTTGNSHYIGLPQNIKGYVYTGGQALLLQLHTMEKGYSMPIYMTKKQANELGAHINKGAKSTDVFKWGLRVFEKETHKRISEDMYRRMTKEEQENYDVYPYLRSFIEFNIDQTNFKEVHPDRYEALLRKFSVEEGKVVRDTTGMYDNEALNRLIHEDGQWICPIIEEKGAQAAYSPGANRIKIPLKSDFNIHPGDAEETFKDGQEYYSSALHEMAHSTGHESLLSRDGVTKRHGYGSPEYAKEELVAELTAATVSNALGFDKRITENSAAYLKGWAASLKQDPRYIVSVMSEVNKAALIELEHIDEQRKALGEKPLLEGNLDGVEEKKHNQQDMEAAVSAALDRGKKEAQLLGLFGLPVQDIYYNKVDLTKEGDDGEVRDLYDRTALYNLYANGENDKVVQRLGEARQKFNLTLDNTLPGSFKYELPDYENIGEDGKYVYMVSSDANEGFVMMEKVSKDDLLHKHLPQHLAPDHLSAIGYDGKKIEDIMALAGELGLALGKPEKNASDTETLTETVGDEKDIKDNSSKEVYYAGASVIEKRYAGSFQAYLENGDTASMLGEARSWMQQNNTTVEQYMIMDSSEVATQDIIAEDDTLAIVDAKLSYDIFPKLTKEEILADIWKNGVDSDATHVVRDIAYGDVARQFSEKKRDSILEMPSGDLLTLRYNKETNTLDVGPGTDASIVVRNAFPYHNGQTLDENLGIVKEELRQLPYYQKTEELSEDKEKRRAVFKEVFSQPSHTMTMPDGRKLDYAYEMEFNTVSFAITAEGVTHVIQSYDYDLGKDLEANLADFKRDLSSRPEFKEQVTSTVDVANASEENVSQIKNNNNMDEKKVTENPEKEVYYVAADTVASEYAEDFEAYRKNGNKAVMLNTARDWMRQYNISVEQHMVMQPSEVVRERIIAEDDNMAVAYNEKSDSYDIMPKLTKEQVLDDIRKNGLDSDASQVVKSIAYEDVARQFGEMEKSPVLEMPSGDILYLQYNKENNKMEVGSGTNVGVAVSHEFDYDLDQSLDENLQIVNEELSKMPEYQANEEVISDDEEKFYSFSTEIEPEDYEKFMEMRSSGDREGLLSLASEYLEGDDLINQHDMSKELAGDIGLEVSAEDDKKAILYDDQSNEYTIYRKVTASEILNDIKENGLNSDASQVVRDIAYEDVARQFGELGPDYVLEMPNGDAVYLRYNKETNKMEAGFPGKDDFIADHDFDYNTSLSINGNIDIVHESLSKMPQYQETEDTSEEEEVTATAEQTATQAATAPRDEKKFYTSFAFMQMQEDTEQFEKLRQEGKYDEMLFLASEHVQDSDIELEYIKENARSYQGDDLVAENEELAIVYNGAVGGTYDLMMKVSENDIREKIEREGGLDYNHKPDYPKAVWDIQRNMVDEEWKAGVKDNLPMDSGDVLQASYNRERDVIDIRDPKKGDGILESVQYFYNESMKSNLGNAYEYVSVTHHEYGESQQKDPKDEKKYYVSFHYEQTQEDTERFDKLRGEGLRYQMLHLAEVFDNRPGFNIDRVRTTVLSKRGDELVVEDNDHAIVYNGENGSTYDLLRKVSENDIRYRINAYGGIDPVYVNHPKCVVEIQRNMIEDEWKNAPDGSIIKTDSGKTFSLAYDREHDKILVSDPEDAEKGILKSFPYNYVHSVRENFRHVYEDMRKLYPQEESKRTVIDDTEKAGILKDIIKFAGDDVAHPLHGVSNMKEFQEAFASSSTEDLYSNYVEDNSVLDYDNESLEEVKGYVASATQGQLVAAGASNLFNYHYPHHEGRTCNSMLHAIMRIENMAAANPDDKQVQKRLSQAYDIYNIYRKRAVEGMSEQQALKFASPLNNNMVPRSHYSDGIRPMALREQFANEHSESLRLYLPNGEEKKARYNKEKDAYDIGHGKGSEFILEQSYPVKDFYMDESIELYRNLTGIVYDNNPNVAVEWDEKVIDNSIVFTDGEKGKVNYDIADDTIEVKSSVSDYEDYDVRIPYDHRISVEENLRRVADVLKYDGYDIKSYPVELSPAKEVISKGVGEQDKPILGMKDYVSSLKDPNDALSGDYSKLPKDSKAYSAWQENERLGKEYGNFVKDPSKYDLQGRAELFSKMGAAGLALSTAVKTEVERYKRLAPAHEDSNIQTNVVADAKKIADSGIPMEKAEKIAKTIASDMAHEDMHHEEQEDQEKTEKEQKQREQAKKEEQKKQEAEKKKKEEQKKETPHMALSHSALILAALTAAKENDGVWMNGGYRSNASFLDSRKPITTYNNIMMNLAAEQQGFKTNVYTNFDLAKQNGMPVLEDQKSLPFSWTNWKYVNKSNEADVLSSKQYHALPKAEQANYVSHAQRVSLPVFNIDQTTLPASDYAAYKEILKKESDRSETLKMDKETNLFRTYSEVSKKHPDSVVLMRDGDSYKSYNASARKVAKALGLPMGKGEYQGKEVDFIEFNFTRLDDYLPRIIRDKNRVAICDRLQDPKYIKDVADSGKILSDAYGLAKSVAKTDGMKYERVMVVQDAKYDRASNTFSVSGMSAEGKDTRTAAIEKATDIYRKLVMVTGLSDRLDRGGRNHLTPIDDVKYDKLVQELGAGVLMARQGLPATLSKEGRELIPYWQMEIKENPRMMGIIERDVNTAVEVIDNLSQGVKPNYMKILGTMPEKEVQNKEDYSVIKNINKLPDIDSKRFVIIKDEKSASVILPKGASLKVDNEVSGMRKERILTVLRKEGVESENVKFYNAGGSLGLKQKNDFFADKTVSLVRLNQWQFEKLQDVKVSSFLPKKEAKALAFTVLKNDDGKYFFHIKPSGEKGFCVDPEKKFVNSYFAKVRTADPKGIAEMKKALSQQFYKLACEHEDMKKDFITPRKIDVDYNRIQRVFVASSKKDPNVKLVSAMIDGERQVATITDSQWKKMWLADDMNAYKQGIAAVAFENILTQGRSQEANLDLNQEQSESVGKDVKNEEQDDVGVGTGKKIISPTPEPEPTRGVRM